MGSRQAIALIAVALCCACAPPTINRPLEGAPPVGEGGAPGVVQAGRPAGAGPPPTLSPPGPSPTASPDQAVASSPLPSPSPPPQAGYYIAATGGRGVNLRDGPSTSARVIVTLREGTSIEVYGEAVPGPGGPWRRIRAGDQEGWIVAGVVRPR